MCIFQVANSPSVIFWWKFSHLTHIDILGVLALTELLELKYANKWKVLIRRS